MIKNGVGVLLSSFILKIRVNNKEQFFETSSVLDETGIFMNVSIGGADGGQMKTC